MPFFCSLSLRRVLHSCIVLKFMCTGWFTEQLKKSSGFYWRNAYLPIFGSHRAMRLGIVSGYGRRSKKTKHTWKNITYYFHVTYFYTIQNNIMTNQINRKLSETVIIMRRGNPSRAYNRVNHQLPSLLIQP